MNYEHTLAIVALAAVSLLIFMQLVNLLIPTP